MTKYIDHILQPGERLGQDTTAATDIEDAQVVEAIETLGITAEARAGMVADIGEADRIELVQDRHLAARVPPLGGQFCEAIDLGGVDRRVVGFGHVFPAVSTPVIWLRSWSGDAICRGNEDMPTPTPRMVTWP